MNRPVRIALAVVIVAAVLAVGSSHPVAAGAASGSPATYPVKFVRSDAINETARLVISENGTYIGGYNVPAFGEVTVWLANGTYTYEPADAGPAGNFTVAGKNLTVPFGPYPPALPPEMGLGPPDWGWLWSDIAAVVLAFLGLFLLAVLFAILGAIRLGEWLGDHYRWPFDRRGRQ